MAELAEQFREAVDPGRLDRLARGLGLSVDGLRRLGIGWCQSSRAWSFPMTDGCDRVIGIRLRTGGGSKFTVRGGHAGLFLPADFDGSGLILVCEGPTDTAALLDLGFQAVGRPSCTGGAKPLTALLKRHHPAEVIIMADGDQRGQDGALSLVQRLVIHVQRLRLITPPAPIKDARAWRRAGATHQNVLAAIANAEVHRLSIRIGEVRHG
jgi:hypothetical protein